MSRSRVLSLCILTALLLWSAFPGGGEVWPLLCIALVPMLYMADRAKPWASCKAGLFCGLIHHVLLLYWLVNVLGYYGGLPVYIAVPALLLLAFYMALYFAWFMAMAAYLSKRLPPILLLFLLPALWVGIDWCRSVVFTGFPWMDLGYCLYSIPQLIQIADLLGHHGISYLLVFINCLFFFVIAPGKAKGNRAVLLAAGGIILGCSGLYSVLRYEAVINRVNDPTLGTATVGVVQGNVEQSLKWSPEKQGATVDNYLKLSASLVTGDSVDFIVWPETALPFYPGKSKHTRSVVDFTREHGVTLLTGAPWYEIIDRKARLVNYYNSAIMLQPSGLMDGKYYKTHLVPFGEYVPLKKLLPFLAPLVEAVGDFTPGTIEHPLVAEDARIGVLICFESVFPELSRDWVMAGANMLVNLTNDAWYGKSSAPYHSLAMAVLRAVETRRSLVRSANTGISAFISPTGSIEQLSEIFVPWAQTGGVVLLQDKTFWVRYGYMFGPVCLIIAVASLFLAAARPARDESSLRFNSLR